MTEPKTSKIDDEITNEERKLREEQQRAKEIERAIRENEAEAQEPHYNPDHARDGGVI